MTIKKKTRRTSNKKVSLNEFKAWLEGIEELQPRDWAPNSDQWKTIRNKIKLIEESEPVVSQVLQPVPQLAPVPQQSAFSVPNNPAPTVEQVPLPSNAGVIPSNKPTIKTPNLDTSDGSFNSAFE